jgi:hypothetical protein
MRKLLAVVALSLVSFGASATVPAGVETVFTTTATDFGTIVGYGWTLFLTIIGGLILFKVAKKVFGKST